MEAHKKNKHIEFILKWAPLFLVTAFILLLLSLRFAPFSFGYLCTAAAMGLVFTILILLSWKLKSNVLDWIVTILAYLLMLFLLLWGQSWAKAWAFSVARSSDLGLWLDVQYFFLMIVVVFAVLVTFRVSIKKFLFGEITSSEGSVES